MDITITTYLAAAFAIMMVPLSLMVSTARIQSMKEGGSAQDTETKLRRRMRTHGNFIEYAPTMIILVGLLEHFQGGSNLVCGVASVFFASRVVHAFGMLYTETPTVRAIAMTAQHAAFLTAGVTLLCEVM